MEDKTKRIYDCAASMPNSQQAIYSTDNASVLDVASTHE